MRRRTMRRGKDRAIFRKTADKKREVNIKPVVMRGGIRL